MTQKRPSQDSGMAFFLTKSKESGFFLYCITVACYTETYISRKTGRGIG